MKKLLPRVFSLVDLLLVPFAYPSAWILRFIRGAGVHNLPNCKNALLKIGVFPIKNQYYEPQFDFRSTGQPSSQARALPGIDWNDDEQLRMLDRFSFAQELADLPRDKPAALGYYLNNGYFQSGDAEYWYQLIRSIKPRRIFEVGSGNSTLMAIKAIRRNREQIPGYHCKHVCVEPYEARWLEESGVTIVRRKIEDLEIGFFSELEENDVLFIDSSHIIRPQGDVLFVYLELLPTLKKGVIVHVHDILSPWNYPREWQVEQVRFWNEQYLLEAFLSHNSSWKIIGALNYLSRRHYERLKSVAPYLTPDSGPGSFYIRKIA